jgi:hypothetical protein
VTNAALLIGVLNEERKLAGLPAVQLERIQASIVKTLKPVRPLAPARCFLFTCAIIFLSIVAIGVMPSGMHGWATLGMGQRVAVFATFAASAVLLGVSTVGQMAPGSKYALVPAAQRDLLLRPLRGEQSHPREWTFEVPGLSPAIGSTDANAATVINTRFTRFPL